MSQQYLKLNLSNIHEPMRRNGIYPHNFFHLIGNKKNLNYLKTLLSLVLMFFDRSSYIVLSINLLAMLVCKNIITGVSTKQCLQEYFHFTAHVFEHRIMCAHANFSIVYCDAFYFTNVKIFVYLKLELERNLKSLFHRINCIPQ